MAKQAVTIPQLDGVEIGAQHYDVVLDQDILEEMGAFGYTKLGYNLIKIYPSENASQLANTLIHEVIHALHYETDVFGDMKPENEEHLTTVMANTVALFMKSNPAFFEQVFALLGTPIRFLDKKEAIEFYKAIADENSAPIKEKTPKKLRKVHRTKVVR